MMFKRDEMGTEPLYFWEKDSETAGNSVRGLLGKGVPCRLSLAGLRSYLEYGCVCEPLTLIDGVRCVPPGCELRNGQVIQYWKPEVELKNWTPEAAQSAVTAAIENAVRRTMERDESNPVRAAFLSGGIDSGTIVAVMRRLLGKDAEIRTYCIMHEDPRTDERIWARKVAERNGTKHTELLLTGETIAQHMMEAVASYDQPSLDGINFWFASKLVSEAGEKTVMSGEGGDELFVGYDQFAKPRQMCRWAKLIGCLRGCFPVRPVGRFVDCHAPNEKWRKLGTLMASRVDPYFLSRRVFSDAQIESLLKPDIFDAMGKVPDYPETWYKCFGDGCPKDDDINAISWKEAYTVLLSMYLHDGWQLSIPFGLDVRTPLVDPALVSLVFSIPGAMKCAPEYLKPFLVRAAGEGYPVECATRKKQGFALPFDRYFKGELKERLDAFLSGETLLFKRDALCSLGRHYAAGKVNWARIWSLFMIEDWCQRNKVTL